mmetsp:Transcript_37499/g.75988  ORF Transcript_37499/g.75988 Transcript_37499/m.75988 type:complete len:430 (-) Transcript_37499:206-1495(-)
MPSRKVALAHLDLGIGGAEALVVSAALAMLKRGWEVSIFTTHHEPKHCFAQTCGDGILSGRIVVVGDWLPRSIFGRAVALCSSVRMCYLAFYMVLFSSGDVVFCDGVSTQIPLLRLKFPVLFYCHFPDLLLCVNRGSFLKRLYRAPLDWLEATTTAWANIVVVNSLFTAGVYKKAFTGLQKPTVVYPAADFDSFTAPDWEKKAATKRRTFVSLNRFERKKDVGVAIEALALLKGMLRPAQMANVNLVVAGGYDESVRENVEYLRELKELASRLGVADVVSFRPSVSNDERNELLQSALAVLYTPTNEHFGIVPIEAMYAGAPVLASNTGGPLETVVDGETGFLRDTSEGPHAFSEAMSRLVLEQGLGLELGRKAHAHVSASFGMEAFETGLDASLLATCKQAQEGMQWRALVLASCFVLLVALAARLFF